MIFSALPCKKQCHDSQGIYLCHAVFAWGSGGLEVLQAPVSLGRVALD